MNKPDLKPCPFCGSDSIDLYEYGNDGVGHIVKCSSCSCSVYSDCLEKEDDEIKEVVNKWNRRDKHE